MKTEDLLQRVDDRYERQEQKAKVYKDLGSLLFLADYLTHNAIR